MRGCFCKVLFPKGRAFPLIRGFRSRTAPHKVVLRERHNNPWDADAGYGCSEAGRRIRFRRSGRGFRNRYAAGAYRRRYAVAWSGKHALR